MSRSRRRDSTGFLWSEPGEPRAGVVAEVAPLVRVYHTYSFAVPEAMAGTVKPGQRVMAPLGRRGRLLEGYVVALDRRIWDSTLRPLARVLESDSFLTPELIELGREIAVHYVCPLGRTLAAMTPQSARRGAGLPRVRYARLLADAGVLLNEGRRLSPRRRALIEHLSASASPVRVDQLLTDCGASPAILRALAKEGLVEITTRLEEAQDQPTVEPSVLEPTWELTEEQRAAVDHLRARIDEHRFSVTLLYGVSSSGKTEVYIRSMHRVLAVGRSVLLLVPEIMLTTQLVARLSSRFHHVAVHHSGLAETQRSRVWRQIASGVKQVILGTRSAVFAPSPNLGLICVDEEQEGSYKNLQAPRFHVRDVALLRAKRLNIPVVLGSATPSVETWYHSEHRPEYRRVVLTKRVNNRPLPKIGLIDMVEERFKAKQFLVLSPRLEELLGETLARGEQALLLVNRRGFATCAYCPACRMTLRCPNCQVNLVVHRASGESVCHYCRTRVTTPTVCPTAGCGQPLVYTGAGTQRVEDLLERRFPTARVRRVDSDTMKHREEYRRIVEDFESRRIDVLVGTQMIAKGLDFPFVSFVGIVHADSAAPPADFRSPERLFQLITQMAGRAGRGNFPGTVIVQTMTPGAPALGYAQSHDYEKFVTTELEARRRAGLPPFRRLARIVLSHVREETVRREAEALVNRIRETIISLAMADADALGPNPCVLPRLRSRYRYDLLIRTPSASSMRRLMSALVESNALRTKAESTIVDVDPITLS